MGEGVQEEGAVAVTGKQREAAQGEKPPFFYELYEGVKAGFCWQPSYTEDILNLPSDEERVNYLLTIVRIGTFGQVDEDRAKTWGGSVAMSQRYHVENSRKCSLGRKTGHGETPWRVPDDYPLEQAPWFKGLGATNVMKCNAVKCSVFGSEEEEEYTGSRDVHLSSSQVAGRKEEAHRADAPFGRCADCELPLVKLPPDYKGEVSYTCPKCGRVYDEPTTGAPPNEEIPF